MSAPIQQHELNPNDSKYYAPPRWRRGKIDAPPNQASLRPAEPPEIQVSIDWTPCHDSVSLADVLPKLSEHSDKRAHSGVRVIALAFAFGVVAWTAFCIFAGLGRLDATIFAKLRNGLLSAKNSEISVSERLHAANSALHKVSRQVLAPTLAVADVSGDVNTALPLAIKITNYTPGITINLSGLVAGTMLSSGSGTGEGNWRVAIDDLPNTRVIPPAEYVGPMTVVAELRSDDDQAIVRTPVRLTWHPVAIGSTEAAEPHPLDLPLTADSTVAPKQGQYEQFLARQEDSTEALPPRRLKARRHLSGTTKASNLKRQGLTKDRHRIPVPPDLETNATAWELRPSLSYSLSANVNSPRERDALWNNDLQTIIDGSWERCKRWSDCGRETRP